MVVIATALILVQVPEDMQAPAEMEYMPKEIPALVMLAPEAVEAAAVNNRQELIIRAVAVV
jgi:hypothetical protein